MTARLLIIQPVLMVRDVAAALAFYERLGFKHAFSDSPDEPKYAGLHRDSIEVHLQWHDASEWGYPNDRPTYRIVVSNVDELSDEFDGALQALDLS